MNKMKQVLQLLLLVSRMKESRMLVIVVLLLIETTHVPSYLRVTEIIQACMKLESETNLFLAHSKID